ncbi:MAG: MFS transporter [Theionarchaea archaeon]|nr:MFS transporter [Theionarchaea archaeon]
MHENNENKEFKIGYIDVLRNRNFFALWIGQLVSTLGDRFNYMALLALILYKMEGSALDVGKLMIFATIPTILFSPIAGVYVDRFDRRKLMIGADIVRATLVIAIPFTTHIYQIYILTFFISLLSRFFFPARTSILPMLLEKKLLLPANSIIQSTQLFSTIVGPAFGAGLVALIGYRIVFFVDSATFLVSAFTIFLIRMRTVQAPGGTSLRDVYHSMVEGFSYIRHSRPVLFIVGVWFGIMLAFGGVNVLYVVFVKDVLGLSIKGIGVLETINGVGMFLGATLVGYVGRKIAHYNLILGGMFVLGVFLSIMALFPVVPISAFSMFIIGLAVSFIQVPTYTKLQIMLPEAITGRIFSNLSALIDTCSLVSIAVLSYGAEIIGVRWVLLIAGIFTVLWNFVAAIFYTRMKEDDL